MKKIPTIFVRDFEHRGRVTPVLTPGCDWILAGEGRATRKRDGTCVLVRDGRLWRRYDAKNGRTPPVGFELVEDDPATGHRVGWIPVGSGPEDVWFREPSAPTEDGTYELCGPKINGNPEGLGGHEFFRHGAEEVGLTLPPMLLSPLDAFGWLSGYLSPFKAEGVVWHHPDGRMAKIKRRDFGLAWPPDGPRREGGRGHSMADA